MNSHNRDIHFRFLPEFLLYIALGVFKFQFLMGCRPFRETDNEIGFVYRLAQWSPTSDDTDLVSV